MDYDQTDMPGVYDRARSLPAHQIERWMAAVARHAPERVERVVDLGCGTGRFTAGLAEAFPAATVTGIDPSEKMLEVARTKPHPRVRWMQGHAAEVPFSGGVVDVLFLSMVFHHLEDPTAAVTEWARLLPAGGLAFVRNAVVERAGDYLVVEFFPDARSLLEEQLPTRAGLEGALRSAGFELVETGTIVATLAPDLASFAERVALRGDSTLARMPDEAFAEGLQRLRSAASGPQGRREVRDPVDWWAFRRP